MHHLVREDITVDAEHARTRLALVSPALTHVVLRLAVPPRAPSSFPPPFTPPSPIGNPIPPLRFLLPLGLTLWRQWFRHRFQRRCGREGGQASEAGSLIALGVGACPGDFFPVAQGEEMVIAPCQMRAQDERQPARRTGGGQRADLAAAAAAEVAAARGLGMACAEGGKEGGDARGETHHQEGALAFECGGGCGRGGGRGGVAQEELAVVAVVEGDGVGRGGWGGGVGARDEGAADGDLGGEADDGAGDVGGGEGGDGGVDVGGVGGEEGADEDEDLARAVGGGVAGGWVLGAWSRGADGYGERGPVEKVGEGLKRKVGGVYTYNSAALPISNAFCKLACPFGSCSLKPCSFAICSLGFPPISLTRTARPSRIPMMPSCEMGFCSKNSATNSEVYRIVSRYRLGRRSFSVIAEERSMTRMRCRMMPRWRGVVSFSVLTGIHLSAFRSSTIHSSRASRSISPLGSA